MSLQNLFIQQLIISIQNIYDTNVRRNKLK